MILYTSDQIYAVFNRSLPNLIAIVITYCVLDVVTYALLFKALGMKWYLTFLPFIRAMRLAKYVNCSQLYVLWALTPVTYIIYACIKIQVRHMVIARKRYSCFVNLIFSLLPVTGNLLYYILWRNEHVNLHKESGLGAFKEKFP